MRDLNSCFEKNIQVVSDQRLMGQKGKVMYDPNVGMHRRRGSKGSMCPAILATPIFKKSRQYLSLSRNPKQAPILVQPRKRLNFAEL